jgi:hypothetical protein
MNEWDLEFGKEHSDPLPRIDLPNGFVICPDRNVADLEHRGWKERLLTWPWKPLTTFKPMAKAYIIGKLVIVSWRTFLKIKNGKGL